MSLTMKELATVMVDQNKEGFKLSGQRRVGKLFNDRAVALVSKQVPFPFNKYLETELGRFLVVNLLSAAIVKFGYTNEKLTLLAEAGILDATDQALGSLNLENIVNDLIDGIDTSGLSKASDTARSATATGLRKASDVVEPTTAKEA